jgi:hypothetical protein
MREWTSCIDALAVAGSGSGAASDFACGVWRDIVGERERGGDGDRKGDFAEKSCFTIWYTVGGQTCLLTGHIS